MATITTIQGTDNITDSRSVINNNFDALNTDKAEKSDVLEKDNTTVYTPTTDYNPATKKYVDDNSGGGTWGNITGTLSNQTDLQNALDSKITGTQTITTTLGNDDTTVPTSKAVSDAIGNAGGGDMLKSTYDTDNDGIVDNAKQVDGKDVSTTLGTDDTTVPTSKAVNDALSGYLDKSTYDTDDDGVVDNSAQLNGQAPSYYLDRANHTGTQDISTINNLQSDLDSKANLSGGNTFSDEQTISNGNVDFALQTFSSSSGNATIDWTLGNKAEITLTENTTLSFTNPGNVCNLLLVVKQDSNGGHSLTRPSGIKRPGGQAPTLTTDANAIDIVSFYFDGTDYYGAASTNFS